MAVATRSDLKPLCHIHRIRMLPVTLPHSPGASTSPAYRCTRPGCANLYDWWRGYFVFGNTNAPHTVLFVNCGCNQDVSISMYLETFLQDGTQIWRCPCLGCARELRRRDEDSTPHRWRAASD